MWAVAEFSKKEAGKPSTKVYLLPGDVHHGSLGSRKRSRGLYDVGAYVDHGDSYPVRGLHRPSRTPLRDPAGHPSPLPG